MKKFYCFFAVFLFTFFNLNANQTFENANFLLNKPNSITFRENKGQVRDQNWKSQNDVLFSGESIGMVFHLKRNGMHYQINRIDSWKDDDDFRNHNEQNKTKLPDLISIYRIDVNWKNTNQEIKIEASEELSGYDNFYNVPEGNEPALFVKSYKSVVYRNVYEGIDLKFFEKEGNLEYDFIVKPKADYRQIIIEIIGAELSLSDKKELIIKTPFGEIREGALKVYQENREIYANWVLSKSGNEVSFDIPNYDSSKELRIDPPVRLWGTYYGGSNFENGRSTATDASGNVYLSGHTNSTNNISTTGAHQVTFLGVNDGFLIQFNSNGERQWGTYYGGSGNESGYSVVTDESEYVYLSGITSSTNGISTTGAHQETFSGYNDGFLVKFNNNGTRQWGTYYGGSGNDRVSSTATDSEGNIYLAGRTASTNGISTTGAQQETFGGIFDGFLVKFNSNGVRQWGTYYGGSGDDYSYSVATDSEGNVYLAGETASTVGISTTGAHQVALNNINDGFLAKFNSNGVRQWGTYYGGNYYDYGYSVVTDLSNNVYLAGYTYSANGISTPGAHQVNFGGGIDAFLAKFNSNGVRQWGTYYGENGNDEGVSLAVDISGYIYLSGYTSSVNNISTTGAHQENIGGNIDGFLAKFNSNGVRQWGTYYGGSLVDDIRSVVTDASGNIFFGGMTQSTNNISTPNAHQVNCSGTQDAYLVKFETEIEPQLLTPVLVFPINNSSNISLNPTLEWEAVENAVSYTLQVSLTNDFTDTLINETEIEETGFDVVDLLYSTQYYWRVNATNGEQTSVWSEIWSFTTETQPLDILEIKLKSGWNLISCNVIPEETELESVFEGMNNIVVVKNQDGQVYSPAFGINQIGNWDIAQGYFVYTNYSDFLNISGTKVVPSDISINLYQGWNLISYLRNSEMPAPDALQGITGNMLFAKDRMGNIYHPGYGINNLGNMQVGQGYWIYMNAPAVLTYPGN